MSERSATCLARHGVRTERGAKHLLIRDMDDVDAVLESMLRRFKQTPLVRLDLSWTSTSKQHRDGML